MSDETYTFKCRRYSANDAGELAHSDRGGVEVVERFVDGALTDGQSLDTILGLAIRLGIATFTDRHGRWTEIEVS